MTSRKKLITLQGDYFPSQKVPVITEARARVEEACTAVILPELNALIRSSPEDRDRIIQHTKEIYNQIHHLDEYMSDDPYVLEYFNELTEDNDNSFPISCIQYIQGLFLTISEGNTQIVKKGDEQRAVMMDGVDIAGASDISIFANACVLPWAIIEKFCELLKKYPTLESAYHTIKDRMSPVDSEDDLLSGYSDSNLARIALRHNDWKVELFDEFKKRHVIKPEYYLKLFILSRQGEKSSLGNNYYLPSLCQLDIYIRFLLCAESQSSKNFLWTPYGTAYFLFPCIIDNTTLQFLWMRVARKCAHCEDMVRCRSACGGCDEASYCNRECQKKDWVTHKALCCHKGTGKKR